MRKKQIRFPIRWKLTGIILIASLIPMLAVGITFYARYQGMITADTIRREQQAAEESAPMIAGKVDEIVQYSDQIVNTEFCRRLSENLLENGVEELLKSGEAERFEQMIEGLIQSSPVSHIRVYLDLPGESDVFRQEALSELFHPVSEISGNYWYGILKNQVQQSLYCSEFYLGIKEREELGNCAYITRLSLNYGDRAGFVYIALYHPESVFGDLLRKDAMVDGGVTYIITNRDAIVATTSQSLSGMYRISYETIEDSLLASNSFVEKAVAGKKVYAAFHKIASTGWFTVSVIPEEPLIKSANTQMLQFVGICIFVTVGAMTVALAVSGSITKRLSDVSGQMNRMKSGVLTPIAEASENDEVGDLIASYNYMVAEMDSLGKKQKEIAEELRRAEFDSLQAQINPHFLYNTMDMINWMTLQGRNEEASEVIQMLARFYKLTLSRKKDYSSIGNEIEHAQVYLNLMNRRYDDCINFVVDIPEEMYEYRIPKLTFQPILENSILHGILESEMRRGTIVMTAWEENSDLLILISDDGAGVASDKVPQILSENGQSKTKGTNIAIYNIHKRLKLLYGERYGLSYESAPGCGCDVTIRIPKQRKEKNS